MNSPGCRPSNSGFLATLPLVSLSLAFLITLPCPVVSSAAEARDLWANALLLSGHASVSQTDQLFQEALLKTRGKVEKALLLISLGDFYSGDGPMVADLEPLANPAAAERIAGRMQDRQVQALEKYLAATVEHPDGAIAWARVALARAATANQRTAAMARLKQADRDNALPFYLEALEHLAAERLHEALQALQAGNKRRLHVFRSPVPESFSISFPDDEAHRAEGIAGQDVPPVLVRFAVQSIIDVPSGSALAAKLSTLARRLAARAAEFETNGDADEALRHFQAVAALGLGMAQADGVDITFRLPGFSAAETAVGGLRRLYERTDQRAKLDHLDRFAKIGAQFRHQYNSFTRAKNRLMMGAKGSEVEIVKRLAQHLEREESLVADLLKRTGLDTFAFDE